MKNLYVGNLPHSTSEADLRSAFEAHGNVERVNIVTDRDTGRARGFAFVEMTNAGEAEKAIASLNGTAFGGRYSRVEGARGRAGGAVPRRHRGIEFGWTRGRRQNKRSVATEPGHMPFSFKAEISTFGRSPRWRWESNSNSLFVSAELWREAS